MVEEYRNSVDEHIVERSCIVGHSGHEGANIALVVKTERECLEFLKQTVANVNGDFCSEVADVSAPRDLNKQDEDSGSEVEGDEIPEESGVFVNQCIIHDFHLEERRYEFEEHSAYAEDATPEQSKFERFGVGEKPEECLPSVDTGFADVVVLRQRPAAFGADSGFVVDIG